MRWKDTPESSAIDQALAFALKHGLVHDKKEKARLEQRQPVGLKVLAAVDFLRARGYSVRLAQLNEIPGFPKADPQRWAAQKQVL
jgi:hypothetical protein